MDVSKKIQDVLDEDETVNLWLLLRRASYASLKARAKELRQYGITSANGGVLFVVQKLGQEATPAEISRQIFREPHSVSGLLKRMDKDGLIRRVKDLSKKNMIRVELTEKGHEAYRQISKRETVHRIISALSEEERQQLKVCLTKIREKALEEFE